MGTPLMSAMTSDGLGFVSAHGSGFSKPHRGHAVNTLDGVAFRLRQAETGRSGAPAGQGAPPDSSLSVP